jgi:hypothetical protein
VRNFKLLMMTAFAVTLVWGCVEDLDTGRNRAPIVWFTSGVDTSGVIFDNAIEFQWTATDYDDDLGMGATYVSLDPSLVSWFDILNDVWVTFEHPDGWVRVYENRYEIIDLPDSEFVFSVRVVDGRGGATVRSQTFEVRFDNLPPIIDNVDAPDYKQDAIDFLANFVIHAHDIARSPWNATPDDSLEYWYRFVSPCEPAIESVPEWSPANREAEFWITGSTCQGKYTFWFKVRDLADNQTEQEKREFEVSQ